MLTLTEPDLEMRTLMFGIYNFPIFVVAGLLLNITPGADMLYAVTNGTARGAKAGVAAALGIAAGIMVHISFAMVGLSALLATSATAFTVVKTVGAAYLIYLGIRLLLERRAPQHVGALPAARGSLFQIFRQGMLINVLNPKIALFFLAFLPQFIASGSAHRAMAFLVLGLTFNLTGACINIAAACSARVVRQRLPGADRAGFWLKKAVGGIFVGLGARLALTGDW